MTDHDNGAPPDQTPARPPVFSERIDGLILRVWELGGRRDLYANIHRFKQLPDKEFEAELQAMLDGLLRERGK